MPVPIKGPRGHFNQLPDVRPVHFDPGMFGAYEGRALQGVGRGIDDLGNGIGKYALALDAQKREKEAADDEAFFQSLQRDQVSMLQTGDRFSDEYADFTPYFSRLGDAANGSASDFMNTFGEHAERRLGEYEVSEERKSRLRARAGGLLNSGYIRLQDFEAGQIRAATGQSLESSLKGQTENIAAWSTDDDMVRKGLGDIAHTATLLARHNGLSGQAEEDFVRTAIGNAESARVNRILNDANAIDVFLGANHQDEDFSDMLHNARRIYSESEALSDTQKQKLDQQISQVERTRERRRNDAVSQAVDETQVDFYDFTQNKVSRDDLMMKIQNLPDPQRAKFEADISRHETLTEKSFIHDAFNKLQNGEMERGEFDKLVATLSPTLKTEVELDLKKTDAAGKRKRTPPVLSAEKAKALFTLKTGYGYNDENQFRAFSLPELHERLLSCATGESPVFSPKEYTQILNEFALNTPQNEIIRKEIAKLMAADYFLYASRSDCVGTPLQASLNVLDETLAYASLSDSQKTALYGKNHPAILSFFSSRYAPIRHKLNQVSPAQPKRGRSGKSGTRIRHWH